MYQFTPELVNFYNKMNARKGKENQFEIVCVSRCRDFESFGQYFTHMNWLAMQPEHRPTSLERRLVQEVPEVHSDTNPRPAMEPTAPRSYLLRCGPEVH